MRPHIYKHLNCYRISAIDCTVHTYIHVLLRDTITTANYTFALYLTLTTRIIQMLSMRTIHQHLALTNKSNISRLLTDERIKDGQFQCTLVYAMACNFVLDLKSRRKWSPPSLSLSLSVCTPEYVTHCII